MSSAADIGYLVGALVGLLIVLGLVVGGILLVVSARKNARVALQWENDPHRQGPPPGKGTGKLVGGIVMIVIGGLGLLGRCAAAVNGL